MASDEGRLRLDGVEAYLANDLRAGTGTISFTAPLTMDGGQPVPTLNVNEFLVLTILDANYVLSEIVHLTSYVEGETVGYIDRGMEGTRPGNHPRGSKVVHAPTSEDFFSVMEHDTDPNAHSALIQSIASGEAKKAVDEHVASANPHPQYVLEASPNFPSGLVVPSGASLTISDGAQILVQSGGKIVLEAGSELHVDGRLFIHGKEIVVSNTEPTQRSANMVWIRTHG